MKDTYSTIGSPVLRAAARLATYATEHDVRGDGFKAADAADALVCFAMARGGAVPADLSSRMSPVQLATLRAYRGTVRTHWSQDEKFDSVFGSDRIGAGERLWELWLQARESTYAYSIQSISGIMQSV